MSLQDADNDYVNTSFNSYDGNQFDFEAPIMKDGGLPTQENDYDALASILDQPHLVKRCNKETFAPRNILAAMIRRNTLAVQQAESDSSNDNTTLKRVLQWYHLMGYGFAATVGAGIFVVAGQVANEYAGPGIIFSFLIAAFSSLLSAFCYSEYAVRVPLSGSAYTFSYVALGEIIGFLYVFHWLLDLFVVINIFLTGVLDSIGWNLTLEYAISGSAVARSWASYLQDVWDEIFSPHGYEMCTWLYNWQPFGWDVSFSPLSCVIIFICSVIMIVGVSESAWVNLIMTIFNLILIIFIIVYGAFYIDTANWTPFLPYGYSGVFNGAAVVFFSYVGFDSVTTLAGEVANTKRDLPIGIVGTLGMVTLLYCLVSLVITGMLPYYKIDVNAGLSDAFSQVGAHYASIVVGLGSVTTLAATTFATLLGQPRIFYQMAKDGLFYSIFGKLTSKGVPAWGTVISGFFAAIFAFALSLGELTDMISVGTLMAFTVVCAGVVILRHQDPSRPADVPGLMAIYLVVCSLSAVSIIYGWPWWSIPLYAIPVVIVMLSFFIFRVVDMPQGFKTPLVPIVPCVGIYINIFLIFSLSFFAILRVVAWTGLGLIIYFTYSIRHSRQGIYEKMLAQSSDQMYGSL